MNHRNHCFFPNTIFNITRLIYILIACIRKNVLERKKMIHHVTIIANKQRKARVLETSDLLFSFFFFLLPLLIYTYLFVRIQKNLLEKSEKEKKKKNGGLTIIITSKQKERIGEREREE